MPVHLSPLLPRTRAGAACIGAHRRGPSAPSGGESIYRGVIRVKVDKTDGIKRDKLLMLRNCF